MVLHSEEDERNYYSLGFSRGELCLELKVGKVEIKAVNYPLGGTALFFSGVRRDTAAWFEIRLPSLCSSDMVAGMIYVNIAKAFPDDAPIWKRHFQNLKVPLFQ